MHALPLSLTLALLLAAPPELAPFLPGTSHPEIPRRAPTEDELGAVRHRTWGLLQHPHAPGVQPAKDLAADLADAMRARQLGYVDAAWIVTRVRDTLAGKLDERDVRALVDDVDGRFDDTPIGRKHRATILRDLRDVLGSAKNELP